MSYITHRMSILMKAVEESDIDENLKEEIMDIIAEAYED